MEKRLTAFLFRYVLKHYFTTRAEMARALNVDIKELQRYFRNLDNAKGGSILLDKLICYCTKEGIHLDIILQSFFYKSGCPDCPEDCTSETCAYKFLSCDACAPVPTPTNLNVIGVELAVSLLRFAHSSHLLPHCTHHIFNENELSQLRTMIDYVSNIAHKYMLNLYAGEMV